MLVEEGRHPGPPFHSCGFLYDCAVVESVSTDESTVGGRKNKIKFTQPPRRSWRLGGLALSKANK